MESVLPFIGKSRADGSRFDCHALVYDAKEDGRFTLYLLTDSRQQDRCPLRFQGGYLVSHDKIFRLMCGKEQR
jgi:hypothetical protein